MDDEREVFLYKKFAKIKSEIKNLDIKNGLAFFDIDLTLIDEFGKANLPILDFYNFLKKQNIKIVLITARKNDEEIKMFTEIQLHELGITEYYDIIFRDPKEKDLYKFKEQSRKKFYEQGFYILMSVGDKDWDIGSYGGIGVLI